MDVTVVIGTFGNISWFELAQKRAAPSVPEGVPVIHSHASSLHEARNNGVEQVGTEWVCHLDADDELEPGYFDAMEQTTADLRAPAVRYVRSSRYPLREARVPDRVELDQGNWLVIGTLVRTELVRQVGGWRDWPFYEDWDLWLRCWQAGATVEEVPGAVYRAHVRSTSRNRSPKRVDKVRVHEAIRAANGLVSL